MNREVGLVPLAVTGANGFLGWHLRARLRALTGQEATVVDRSLWGDPTLLAKVLESHDSVVHLAGVNRAASGEDVEAGNIRIGRVLAEAIRINGVAVHVVNGNSIQAVLDNPYGRGKSVAADLISQAVREVGGSFHDVMLPNLFGEHGRPHYNSVVATFCHELNRGHTPDVLEDRELRLLHAQKAAQFLIDAANRRADGVSQPRGHHVRVSRLLGLLVDMRNAYSQGDVPDLSGDFIWDLFNTYRSFSFPHKYPAFVKVYSDARGELFEGVRAHGGQGQCFVSTTKPGRTRGDHYHVRKFERFMVIKGEAEISLRRVLHQDIVRFGVSGDRPSFVDMPTLWTHNIRNIGGSELVTIFWSNRLLDPADVDQFPEPVELAGVAS